MSDEKFCVYSTGWDGKDGGGKELYVSGAINYEKSNQDIGFCFSIK